MSDDDHYGFELSEDSLKHIEAGAAAHRAALEINHALRDQLDHVKVELAKANTENDQLRIVNHDLAAKLLATESVLHDEIAKSSAYWATIEGVAAQILNVRRKVDPAETSNPTPIEDRHSLVTRKPQDAKNGDGGDLPRAFLTARSLTGGGGS